MALIILAGAACATRGAADEATAPAVLAGTRPLAMEGDLAEQMIAGVDRFLLRELDRSLATRGQYWHRDLSSPAAYVASIAANRQRFAEMIGLREQRPPASQLELLATRQHSAMIARSRQCQVFAVRWQVLPGITGEGLFIEPRQPVCAHVVVIPDCEQTPESLVFDAPGQPVLQLAASGCQVLVPVLINRQQQLSVIAGGRRKSTAHHREILYRAAYQMGRHLIGYEVQKVLAAIDCMHSELDSPAGKLPTAVIGYGEGGLMALYAGAVDPRIDVTGVSAYFDSRQNIWREPIDHNLFGLLREFGDAEIASLIAPRSLIIEAARRPAVTIPPGGDSAPGELLAPLLESVEREWQRACELTRGIDWQCEFVASDQGQGDFGSAAFLASVTRCLNVTWVSDVESVERLRPEDDADDATARQARQFHELLADSQKLVEAGPETRARFFENLNYQADLGAYAASVEPYRRYFREEIIGKLDYPRLAANPRTRLAYEAAEYRGYEVLLDVLPDVMLYGILLIPTNIQPGEQRPVVVCQHGLEGRAQFTVEGDYTSYRGLAARLAQRGFITFSPQHLYRGGDAFRTLQRKANPLKQSLFSIMVAQHEQLLDWLHQLEIVDGQRIGFYGISYGGKSAMRIPAVLDGYCLSICSSDFSDWIWRTVSDRFESGYLAHSEYEIFEFNLGATFNYSDMAALICPRPFMVERFESGHMVVNRIAAEYGKVRLLYDSLGIADRTRISYYPAFLPSVPYQERETFSFLESHLRPGK